MDRVAPVCMRIRVCIVCVCAVFVGPALAIAQDDGANFREYMRLREQNSSIRDIAPPIAPPERPVRQAYTNVPGALASPPSQQVSPVQFEVSDILDGELVDVVIEGNDTISSAAILQHIKSRSGRPPSPRQIQEDVAELIRLRWFLNVHPVYRQTSEGPILVFQVTERPIVRSVQFIGNKKLKTGELQANVGLRTGSGFDVAANKESVYRIQSLYQEKGYRFAKVTLRKGGNPDDRDVIFDIEEGPKVRVWGIHFSGNENISSAILKTKLSTKTTIAWYIGGTYDPETIRNDVLTLRQYYTNLGYFEVTVDADEQFSEKSGYVTVNFNVHEGPRYKVGTIDTLGNDVIESTSLLNELKLERGDYFNARFLREDVTSMKDQYDELGRVFTKVEPVPHFRANEPGWVDLVYQVEEDVPRLIGTINVHIRGDYPHTKEEVVLQQMHRFIKPGQLANGTNLQMAQSRVMGSQLWERSEPPAFDIKPVDGHDYLPPVTARGQDGFVDFRAALEETSEEAPLPRMPIFGHSFNEIGQGSPPEVQIRRVESGQPAIQPKPEREAPVKALPLDAPQRTDRKTSANYQPIPEFPTYRIDPDAVINAGDDDLFTYRAQSPDAPVYRGQSITPNGQPNPQNYMNSDSPQGDPYGDALRNPNTPAFVDVNVDVTEGRTGRLMFGVGVNSNAGVVGSIVLQEDNFDILNPPRSWSDIINGTAWRGNGESFRLEAVPGYQVSRYTASWQNPNFLRSDFSLGVSGFYYNRFFTDWTEDRLGGRISVGKVLNRYWSAGVSVRLEDVGIRSIRNEPFAPADLLAAKGNSLLSTVGATATYDTRDSAFMPTRGHYIEGSFEQAFGEFDYSRVEVSGGQYFTIYERPDGYGKHILSVLGQAGGTGGGTPIFERFYAGGYSSFRGFGYRGVSPRQLGYVVGGNFMAVGTVEYMVPLTASDNIRAVVFTDMGTVEDKFTFNDFRMTAGFGFRMMIPAMGPAPLAFDFAWPIMSEKFDTRRVFSFYIGFTR